MDFTSWQPVYEEILQDLGFSRAEDERAALLLSHLLEGKISPGLGALKGAISGKHVLVCGNGPNLAEDLGRLDLERYVVIAADGATTIVMDTGRIPDIIVTDLDGDVEREIEASEQGSLVVVHAHGDNMSKLLRYVPQLTNIIGSTQAVPLQNVFNFGGFTDGDRAVHVAIEFGAETIKLAGFFFDDPVVSPAKSKKLKWARRLISSLGVES
ncbi:putative Rossmann fold enzyme [Methanomethylovorans hollandica DSM 15978]|uniref:6-hydroxymethyl-7,8-dihydropterin pyrophosphokinase n=1 Tax=Methanomethylovorans hollandica (strain DSM 15978 / NBRC 107637 / DMS1) TaxID=867904 RepID=L0KWB9_METHD|nr:6-hydroxymethylpterin diphosphokinase MptE-like protein [Methanomethylovorans hollandica]AGB49747.1 putative Rossmann fold enzyme [Methanomethylovorans hollandica DSM 15978]